MRRVLIYMIVVLFIGHLISCSNKNTETSNNNIEIKGIVQRKYKTDKKIDLLDSNNNEWSVYFSFDTPITLKNGTTGHFDNIQDGELLFVSGRKENEFVLHASRARKNEKIVTATSFMYHLYFPNSSFESQQEDCKNVYEVNRKMKGNISLEGIPKFTIILTDLIQGPTQKEKSEGYFTSLPTTTEVNDLNYSEKDQSLWIDFKTIPISGSCNVINARKQIVTTFTKLDEISEVHILLNGSESEALQP